MSKISLTAIALQPTLKSQTQPLNPVLFILSTDQSFEIFHRHNGVATISESFALNLIISVPLTNK